MTKALLRLSVVLVMVGLSSPLSAQAPADAAHQVDEIFEPWSSMKSPGCAVAVAQSGLTIFSRAYGMADLEHDIPNKPSAVFKGGSVSKQFTAAAIILLVLDDKRSLDDDVRKPVYHDTFDVPGFGLLRFHRDANGPITELSLRRSRVYDMRFKRVATD